MDSDEGEEEGEEEGGGEEEENNWDGDNATGDHDGEEHRTNIEVRKNLASELSKESHATSEMVDARDESGSKQPSEEAASSGLSSTLPEPESVGKADHETHMAAEAGPGKAMEEEDPLAQGNDGSTSASPKSYSAVEQTTVEAAPLRNATDIMASWLGHPLLKYAEEHKQAEKQTQLSHFVPAPVKFELDPELLARKRQRIAERRVSPKNHHDDAQAAPVLRSLFRPARRR